MGWKLLILLVTLVLFGSQTKGGRVDWGPLVGPLESPHLSVIFEASTDESVGVSCSFIPLKLYSDTGKTTVHR